MAQRKATKRRERRNCRAKFRNSTDLFPAGAVVEVFRIHLTSERARIPRVSLVKDEARAKIWASQRIRGRTAAPAAASSSQPCCDDATQPATNSYYS